MKKVRPILLFFVLFTFAFLLSGCRCYPGKHDWEIVHYTKGVEFIGGITREVTYNGASFLFPFAVPSSEETYITFTEDGKVSFKPCDGEFLEGTYTIKHNGFSSTDFTLTFENGEKAEGNGASYMMSGTHIEFSFRGITYRFEPYADGHSTQDDIVWELRNGNDGTLKTATVTKSETGFTVSFSNDSYSIVNETAVCAMLLDTNDMLIPLGEVREGECLAVIDAEQDIVTLYYIEPTTMLLSDYETWVKEIVDTEIAEITLIKYYTCNIDEVRRTLTDQTDIGSIMATLRDCILTKMPNTSPNPQSAVDIIMVKTKDSYYTLTVHDSYLNIDGTYWQLSQISG